MTEPLNALIVKEGEGVQDAVSLGDGIFMSKGISNSYLVTTRDGDVLINTGMHFEAEEIKRRFSLVSGNAVAGDPVHTRTRRPRRRLVAAGRARYRDHRAGEPCRRPRVLAPAATLLHRADRTALGPRHRQRRPLVPAARTRRHHDLLRQSCVHPRRPPLRAVLDTRRRNHRLADGLAPRREDRVHRQPLRPLVRARAKPVHVARGQVPERYRLSPCRRSRPRASRRRP